MTERLSVQRLLRIEWFAVAVAAVLAYWLLGASWLLFALLILVPDLSMIGYLAGNRVGAAAYNAAHLLVWPALLFGIGLLEPEGRWMAVAIIWLVHIAVDRSLGYGLRYASGFRDTHTGRIGLED